MTTEMIRDECIIAWTARRASARPIAQEPRRDIVLSARLASMIGARAPFALPLGPNARVELSGWMAPPYAEWSHGARPRLRAPGRRPFGAT
jgi:hypothetical protein